MRETRLTTAPTAAVVHKPNRSIRMNTKAKFTMKWTHFTKKGSLKNKAAKVVCFYDGI